MQNFQSLLGTRCGTNGRNFEYGKDFKILATTQQVLNSPSARGCGTGLGSDQSP